MTEARPFESVESLAEVADRTWRGLSREDWLEAFAAHPVIGGSAAKSASGQSQAWSLKEQSGTVGADAETRAGLAVLNLEYAERFGHVFLVCATGRSAAEMLALGQLRLRNDPATELAIAAEEQRKITRLRLEKLLSPTER
jgi:OHCU decarboxylase